MENYRVRIVKLNIFNNQPNMLEVFMMVKRVEKGNIIMVMEELGKVNGKTIDRTGMVNLKIQREFRSKDIGLME